MIRYIRNIILTIIILFTAFVFCSWLYFAFHPVIKERAGIRFLLKPGMSAEKVIKEFSAAGIIAHPLWVSSWVYLRGDTKILKSGEYFFPYNVGFLSVWTQMVKGTGRVYHPFTIIPGWTFMQLREAMEETQGLVHNTRNLSNAQLMQSLGYPILSPEGEFFSETYFYTYGETELSLYKQAFFMMQEKLAAAWNKRDANLPFQTQQQVLIAASLVEKEAYVNEERSVIAGVLVNRLNKRMLLQFDPTVIYGLGTSYNGKLYKADLLKDTPYNTYIHKGLPPTPIAMPSMGSILAVLHPQRHDYLYFVAKGDGSHQFSKTLQEHNKAVKTAEAQHTQFFNAEKMQDYVEKVMSQS
ncbi:MAG: hypothetical protein A3E83_08485 [Gammaproteobacteria bacterium RIFCSPHIGHO2_12_FULL_41_20]|nr:MAG: hypothetical protein A3E83_08485 [Gammaproteobacteria bacterium RIFCSPHIGHO2_12_FULL_41_20]